MNVVKEDVQLTAARILEDWGMMLVDRAETVISQFDMELPFYISSIAFKGIVNGKYMVVCQEGFARTLASNLLGVDAEVTEADTNDALKEMINVLSGNLLTASYGEDTVFDLSAPMVERLDPAEVEKYVRPQTISFTADCEPVMISFSLQGYHVD